MAPGSAADFVAHRSAARGVAAQVALLLAFVLVLGGCGAGGPIRAQLHADVERPQPGIVLFVCDGLGGGTVEEGCRAGWLPNIQKRFVERGTRVAHATTCIPPITYGAVASLLTGVGPGRHAVVGNRWFDPDEAFFRNYATIEDYRDINQDCAAPMIYELIRPAPSVSIQAAHTRGVTANLANWAPSGVMWFFGDYTAVDKMTATSLADVAWWANRHRRWPTLLTCYFPGVDTIGHRWGTRSARFRWALTHLDYQIGRVCDWLEEQGLLETTYLVLASDHGMIDVGPDGIIDLMRLVRDEWGRKTTDRTLQEGPAAWRRAYFDQFDTVVAYQNGRGAFLYFRGPSGWGERPTPDVVAAILAAPPPAAQLWNIPGVELVAFLAADDEAILRCERGEACIRVRTGSAGPEYAYLPAPDDVLGYLEDPNLAVFVTAGCHTSREWLHATAGQTFPDVVPHLISLLGVHRAGQVVVFTKPGYSFVREKAGHGGMHRDELWMTFMLAGPGIVPGGTIDVVRSVDLVPTLLDLLGKEPPADAALEGVSLLEAGLLSAELERTE